MARRRMIDPEFWKDKEFFVKILNACREVFGLKRKHDLFQACRNVRLFYVGLWNFSDDSGRFRNETSQLLADIAPYEGDYSAETIEKIIRILVLTKRVFLYEVKSVWYGIVVKLLKHQTINRPTPSRLPSPPEPRFSEWLSESNGGNSVSDSRAREVKLSEVKKNKKIASGTDGLKDIQNKNIKTIQNLFSKRFGKELTPAQVQVLVHGGGRGKIYGFVDNYDALGMAITEMPQDVKDSIQYVFKLANHGLTVEKYCKRAREKAEGEKDPKDMDIQKLFS